MPKVTPKDQAKRERQKLEAYCQSAGLTFKEYRVPQAPNAKPEIVCTP